MLFSNKPVSMAQKRWKKLAVQQKWPTAGRCFQQHTLALPHYEGNTATCWPYNNPRTSKTPLVHSMLYNEREVGHKILYFCTNV